MNKLVLILTAVLSGCAASAQFGPRDVEHFQPPIVATAPPEKILVGRIEDYTRDRKLSNYLPLVPAFNAQGHLLASWNIHQQGVKNRPTFIIVHGGHGVTSGDVGAALWLQKELGANVLVLDSFWSRGRQENFASFNEYGVNMRALDAIAAARYVLSQGADADSIYLMGGSQGGWTVLRTLTDEPFYNQYARPLFRAGVSLYPLCQTAHMNRYKPRLGPYIRPVIVFTGGQDDATPSSQCDRAIFTSSTTWIHYPDATHGWDIMLKGMYDEPPKNRDGDCVRALNVYNRFKVCRSNAATEDMRSRIKSMVKQLTPYNIP